MFVLFARLFLAQLYLTATRIQLLLFLWYSRVSDILKIENNNIKQKRVKGKMERRVEMSSAGCSTIHFHAHKAECFVCSVVNKIEVPFCLLFLLALKASNQHITAPSNLFIIEPRGVESASS